MHQRIVCLQRRFRRFCSCRRAKPCYAIRCNALAQEVSRPDTVFSNRSDFLIDKSAMIRWGYPCRHPAPNAKTPRSFTWSGRSPSSARSGSMADLVVGCTPGVSLASSQRGKAQNSAAIAGCHAVNVCGQGFTTSSKRRSILSSETLRRECSAEGDGRLGYCLVLRGRFRAERGLCRR